MKARFYRYCLIAAGVLLAAFAFFAYRREHFVAGWLLTMAFAALGVGFRGYQALRGFSYTVMIFAAVTASMYFPQYFTQIGGYKLSNLIVPLLQIIMFGMGAALSWRDFAQVAKMPHGVFVGVVCQFSIMPVVGFTLASVFGFPAEIAAGIILVGCSPSGLASNVMSYLARANLALSVSLTAVATLLAPFMTPLLMKLLAGQFVAIDFWGMMWSITKIVIIPIIAGLLFNHFFHGRFKWVDQALPLLSMVGIAVIITIITAAGRDSLLAIGLLLVAATLTHNLLGYFLGYWLCRLLRMSERDCRTIALEVGMQNGGLASGIALEMGKVATVGLAPAVFGPMMNITGSALATWWRGRPLSEEEGMAPTETAKAG
jgi:BASS family bile acid:Na+ symporter